MCAFVFKRNTKESYILGNGETQLDRGTRRARREKKEEKRPRGKKNMVLANGQIYSQVSHL